MTKLDIYRYLHYAGVFTLLFSFGSLFLGRYNKGAAAAHGIALLLILVTGFGMQATLHLGFPVWLIAKMVIWVLLGGFVLLAKKGIINGVIALILILALSLAGVYLAKTHPLLDAKIKVLETR